MKVGTETKPLMESSCSMLPFALVRVDLTSNINIDILARETSYFACLFSPSILLRSNTVRIGDVFNIFKTKPKTFVGIIISLENHKKVTYGLELSDVNVSCMLKDRWRCLL